MNLRRLQRRRQTIRRDKVSFRNEKPRTTAESPLRRLTQFLSGLLQFLCFGEGSLSGASDA